MRSIRSKITVTVVAISMVSLFILTGTVLYNLNTLRSGIIAMSDELGTAAGDDSAQAMEQQMLNQLTALAQAKAAIADEKLGKQQTYVQLTADYLTALYGDPDKYAPLSVDPPDPSKTGVFSSQLVLSPEAADDLERIGAELGLVSNASDLFLAIPMHDPDIESDYFSTVSGINVMIDKVPDMKPATLDASSRGWFQGAIKENGLIWTDVFDDTWGRGLAITCAAPFRNGEDGEIMGVVGFGSLISTMSGEIIDTRIGETGYAFVINELGQTIISPNIQKDSDGKIIREDMTQNASQEIRDLAQAMLQGEAGVSRLTFDGREVYMAYEPMSVLPWTVVTVINVEEALAPAAATRAGIDAMTERTIGDVDLAIRTVITAVVIILVLALGAVAVASSFLAGRLTRPLGSLLEGVKRIGDGDLDAQIHVETKDEIGTLADAFNDMTGNLKRHVEDLTAVTAEKERIGAELDVATQIQKDMLPSIFPAFPEQKEFAIYATMDPAKEVGGDFYDFFMIDDSHLAVVMADVSGKGVPAALFMVIAKTVIKNQALAGDAVEQVFMHANDQLCENNGEGLFVTSFMGVLDLKSGEFTYVNAGHNPPLLRRKGGSYEYLKVDPGFVLAGLEGMPYSSETLTMSPGDSLYLYTDGVTEALNVEQELFGEERLQNVLNAEIAGELGVRALLPYVRAELERYAQGAEQADDITMLALTYYGEGAHPAELNGGVRMEKTITVPAQCEQLDVVQGFVNEMLEGVECDPGAVIQLQIAVEEIFVNIANYAYTQESGTAEVECHVEPGEGRITIRFKDQGIPFDPLAKEDADVTLSAEEREIGGLGIYMVKEMMDGVDYKYENGSNILTIHKMML